MPRSAAIFLILDETAFSDAPLRIVAHAWLSESGAPSGPVVHVGATDRIADGCPDTDPLPRRYQDYSGESE